MMLGGARVLVVDDDHAAASTLTLVLNASGFHTATVPDVTSALGVTLDEDVAVLLCAFTRRGVGATTDLVTALRGRPEPRLRDARVIALVDHEEDTWLGLGAAVDEVLVRPVHAQRLADAVTGLASLSRRRPASGRCSDPSGADPSGAGPLRPGSSSSSARRRHHAGAGTSS